MTNKRAFIIHGWDGYPQECWFPWLKQELEANGFLVVVPQMPEPSVPRIEVWVSHLATLVGNPDSETYFIGHSIGVQTILRYLETINISIGGVVSVAGFFTLIPGSIGEPQDEKIVEPWLTRSMNLDKIKQNANKIIAIFSDNDRYVGIENVELFKERVGAETILLHNKGHFSGSDHAMKVAEILKAILQVSDNTKT